jgi:hypothetical protein
MAAMAMGTTRARAQVASHAHRATNAVTTVAVVLIVIANARTAVSGHHSNRAAIVATAVTVASARNAATSSIVLA